MKGKVAIVTGSGSGIGAACAKGFAKQGVSVLLADINGENAEARVAEITADGGTAAAYQVDLADETAVQAMIEAAVEKFGRLDILHNNAAATAQSVYDDDLITTDISVWDTTFAVNLRAPMIACKYAIPHMINAGGGVIINTSSGSGLIGEPTRFAYGMSKAGLNSLTRSIAARYGKQNIRCVAVAPGITLAQTSQDFMAQTGWLAMMRRHHATPFLAVPEDIANFVVFLASDDARFITGSTHSIDGGNHTAAAFAADMRDNGYGIF